MSGHSLCGTLIAGVRGILLLVLVGSAGMRAVVLAATPTPTVTAGSRVVRISVGSAVAGPGEVVHVVISLAAVGVQVAATANDLNFPADTLSLEPAGCGIDPSIDKSLRTTVVSPDGAATTTIRTLIQSTQNSDPIPNGPLYTCAFRIAPGALPGTYRLESARALAFDPAGAPIDPVVGTAGSVNVSLIGRACGGDCNQDNSVTVDEILSGVSIALGDQVVGSCPAFDADGSGMVTVDEILAALTNALEGCFTPPTPTPQATPTSTVPPTPLFVRSTGSDANSGVDAQHALRTISRAVQLALSDYKIIVGPGTYVEGVTTSGTGPAPHGLQFVADVAGRETDDAPGPVLIDATGSLTGAGFRFANVPGGTIDGFMITGGVDGGIVLKSGSNNFKVQNCVVFNNPGSGIRIQDSADVLIFNNLVYGNDGEAVAIVGQGSGSPNNLIFSNTIVGNGNRGLTVGTTQAASPGALIRNNVVQGNGGGVTPALQNIKVFTAPRSDLGYDEDFNLVFPGTYLPAGLAGAHDINADAGFVFPGGADFHLRATSPAIDAGAALPLDLEAVLHARTSTGGAPDIGALDLGFHYLP